MKRYFIIFEGRVQGVGFRWTIMRYAKELNLTGYCKNLDNGNVEAEIQGENIDAFLKLILNSGGFIHISDYAIKEIKLKENEKNFTVRF